MKTYGFGVVLAVLLTTSALAGDAIGWPEIEGAENPRSEWLITGQPEPHELVAAQRAGARHVVNARDLGEFEDWDEKALVGELGLSYHRVPIGSPDDLDREAVESFDRILAEIGDEPALMHCASGNRIGALFALRAGWLQGKDDDTAIEIGRQHGLTALEDQVRRALKTN